MAWNADGIVVLSQSRSGAPAVTGNTVRENVVAMAPQPGDVSQVYALAWIADWASPMFTPEAGNLGQEVAVSLVGTMPGAPFAWDGDVADPGAFSETPGGAGLQVLEPADAHARLTAAGVPTEPIALAVHSEVSRRELLGRALVVAVGVALLLILATAVVLVRRRRRDAAPPVPPAA